MSILNGSSSFSLPVCICFVIENSFAEGFISDFRGVMVRGLDMGATCRNGDPIGTMPFIVVVVVVVADTGDLDSVPFMLAF